ncbi:MAG: PEP-CTERM sorting domain-containing protein [Rhodocyclaceae bacterium]|nr:MAG: PEP-CTERM sorting domain-containing protein [Rhodocyclaceae bacterium]
MKATPLSRLLAAALLSGAMLGTAHAATANVRITEWMYNGNGTGSIGEFIELTNLGTTTVDFTGWSFDDNSRTAGSENLSGFGTVAAGESVIFTDQTAAAFRANWNLSASVKVLGGNLNNLGRSDEVNVYDGTGTLVDRLTYNDQGTGSVAGPRTTGVSGIPGSLAAVGANNASLWTLSAVGDGKGSYLSSLNEIGSPGYTPFASVAAVPEPESYTMLMAGLGLIGVIARRRSRNA